MFAKLITCVRGLFYASCNFPEVFTFMCMEQITYLGPAFVCERAFSGNVLLEMKLK